MQWLAIAAEPDVGTRPLAVTADGIPLVVWRPEPGADPVVFADRCPHRLVPLSAATPEGGRLRCAYHGWEFDSTGACKTLPSQEGRPPPRAALDKGPRVRVQDGVVEIAAEDLPAPDPDDLFTNEDPSLLHAWHPIGLADDPPTTAMLVGREFEVARERTRERWGLLWLAPEEPLTDLFDDPDDDPYTGAWLPPVRTPAAAGVAADNFLDVAHFPFVHAGTFGAEEAKLVDRYEVVTELWGCRSIQEQWFDNPGDPGVAQGVRPVRQRRRATYVYRAPFQLMLRLEELDAGAVKTILFFSQPESLTSTRLYTKMLLHGIGGVPDPSPDVVRAEVEFEERVLAEDLELQRRMRLPGLPLKGRDELHVRADLLGVHLRRTLAAFRKGTAE
ncbi:Rieske 2Fe-2S domain-containing protein [Actinoplanes bogorensis]|uniref:Rieske 2Fe-2S domain-containing protein n=1 Tax=Paractinoplanes bogorensis TaxID=1610840 RepID=A0ABS5YMJ5_9ACTN|nr:Rieske 2Fe-2S domain-containing protein [Actinoplanes bogorensis]MBU2664531.1 Rieske 2Fe-2S domain-containing protein [Actinoplanes bogorensis]